MTAQNTTKKATNPFVRNPLEVDSNNSKSGRSFLDSMLGVNHADNTHGEQGMAQRLMSKEHTAPRRRSESVTVFHGRIDEEKRIIPQQMQEMRSKIDEQLVVLKRKNSEFISEINQIEKETLQSLPDKPGIYHVRFLELILSYLQILTAKVGEAKTWMSAMRTKKAKRGSLFAARSKNQGTQYSLSQELQSSRSVM